VGFHSFDVKGIGSGTGPVKFRVRLLTDGALETDLRILE